MHAFIIALDRKEIGYIQLYNAHDYERDDGFALECLSGSLAALDIIIGEAECMGKGYGSTIMKQFLVQHVDPSFDACFVDQDIANVQAVRAYEKAGFVQIKTVKNGAGVWMVRGKPDLSVNGGSRTQK